MTDSPHRKLLEGAEQPLQSVENPHNYMVRKLWVFMY